MTETKFTVTIGAKTFFANSFYVLKKAFLLMFSHVLGKNWREKYWRGKIGKEQLVKLVSTISILEFYWIFFLDKTW